MTEVEATYTLDNAWEKARQRLALLEGIYDPSTILRCTALGVGVGWRCLELGAGGGSIARWLCDTVGPTGTVTAVDLEPRFLEADPRPNLDIRRRDILAEGIPGDGYDLIHARALLMHLPTRGELITDLAGRLRPGGVLLLEEADAFTFGTAESALYRDVLLAGCAAAAKAGGDFFWARHLPARLAAAGLTGVTGTVDASIFPGGSPWAQFAAMTVEQLTPLLLDDGVSAEQIAAFNAELSDPTRWFPSVAVVAAWGRRPS